MTRSVSIHQFALKHSLIVAIIPIIYSTILFLCDLLVKYHGDELGMPLRIPVILFFMPIIISFAMYRYKKINNQRLNLQEALIIGLEISLVIVGSLVLYDVLFNHVLAPSYYHDYYETYGDQLFQELVSCCNYTQEQFQHHKEVRLHRSGLSYLGDFSLFMVFGAIITLITGLVMRKTR